MKVYLADTISCTPGTYRIGPNQEVYVTQFENGKWHVVNRNGQSFLKTEEIGRYVKSRRNNGKPVETSVFYYEQAKQDLAAYLDCLCESGW